jgi:hypothetical protein
MMAKRSDALPLRDPEVRQHVDDAIRPYAEYPIRHDERPRVATNLDPELMRELEALAAKTGKTKASIVREAIQELVMGDDQPTAVKNSAGQVVIRSTKQVVFQAQIIIAAVDDALNYDPHRHHNHPPPALRIENPAYLDELRRLVVELRRLNDSIKALKPSPNRTAVPSSVVEKSAIDVRKHVNTFLDKYASTLATGVGILTVGALGSLLFQLGLPEEILTKVLAKVR